MPRLPEVRHGLVLVLLAAACEAAGPDGPGSLEEPLRIDGYAEELVPIGALAVAEDGTMAFMLRTEPALRGTLGRSPDGRLLLRTVDDTGGTHLSLVQGADGDTLAIAPLPAGINGGAQLGEDVFVSLAFSNHPRYAVAADGQRAVIVMPEVLGEEVGTFTATALDLAGDTAFHARYPFAAVPLTAAEAEAEIEARVARDNAPDPYGSMLRAGHRRQTVIPEVVPPFRSLMLGTDGSVWIEQQPRDGQRAYYALAANGAGLGRVLLPEHARVGAARQDRIWVLEADSMDVESVVRYGMRW